MEEASGVRITDVPARARLLVADDNPRVIEQLMATLGSEFEVVACAATGRDAVDEALRHSPDLLVLDIAMPIMSGIRAAQHLRAVGCRVPVVFLTMYEDEDYVRAAQEVGALGYVLKSNMASDLVPAIRAALGGVSFISKWLSH